MIINIKQCEIELRLFIFSTDQYQKMGCAFVVCSADPESTYLRVTRNNCSTNDIINESSV